MSDLGRLGARPTSDIGVHVRPGGLTPSEEPGSVVDNTYVSEPTGPLTWRQRNRAHTDGYKRPIMAFATCGFANRVSATAGSSRGPR